MLQASQSRVLGAPGVGWWEAKADWAVCGGRCGVWAKCLQSLEDLVVGHRDGARVDELVDLVATRPAALKATAA